MVGGGWEELGMEGGHFAGFHPFTRSFCECFAHISN